MIRSETTQTDYKAKLHRAPVLTPMQIAWPVSFSSFPRAADGHIPEYRACIVLTYQAIDKTFQDPLIFESVPQDPGSLVASLVDSLHRRHGKSYPWAVGHGRQLPAGYILAKRKKDFRSGRPIISFVDSPFRPMLNILARLIFQLIPVACPNHFASGDVYTFLSILNS